MYYNYICINDAIILYKNHVSFYLFILFLFSYVFIILILCSIVIIVLDILSGMGTVFNKYFTSTVSIPTRNVIYLLL